jgi:Ca2+-binding RTX toxin-like protein
MDGGADNDTLDGGDGADLISGGLGDDQLIVSYGADTFSGGDGTDLIDFVNSTAGMNITLGTGGSGMFTYSGSTNMYQEIEGFIGSAYADSLKGNDDANTLKGMDNNDQLFGFGGDDYLYGGLGVDALTGGNGNDTFYYADTTDGGDSIVDFDNSVYDDIFVFDSANFDSSAGFVDSAIGGYDGSNGSLGTSDATFVYDSTNNELWYDSNGDNSGGAQSIATVSGDAVTVADIDFTTPT